MSILHRTAPVAAVAVLAMAFTPAAMARHGGRDNPLPTGGGDIGGAVTGGGGGGGSTAPASSTNLTGTWTGVETTQLGPINVVLSIKQDRDRFDGSLAEIVAGDSPVFKIEDGTLIGDRLSLHFTQGGKASLHPDLGLSGTVSADGRTIIGVFAGRPLTLTR